MIAVKAGNYTQMADGIDLCAFQMEWQCYGCFMNYFPLIANCYLGILGRQLCQLVVPDGLALVEIY